MQRGWWGAAAAAVARPQARRLWVPGVPAVVALAVTLPWVDRAALWQDELATVSAATRSWPDLARLVAHVDGVLAVYYGLQHVWTGIAGVSAVSLRLPSVVATAVAAALLAVLGARLGGPRAGVVAGLLLAVAPVTSRYATDARPYALVLAAAVAATLALDSALRSGRRRIWALYAGLVATAGALQVSSTLLVLAHAATVAAALRAGRRSRDDGTPEGGTPDDGSPDGVRPLAGFVVAVVVAAAAVAPFAALGARERHQISWLRPPTAAALAALPGELFLSGAVAAALAGAAALAAAGPAPLRRAGLGWAVLPVAGSVLVSLVAVPVTAPRYLLLTVPGWALLAAAAVRSRGAAAALVAVVAVAGLGSQVVVRDTVWGGQPDYRQVADVLRTRARPGDAIAVPASGGVRYRVGLRVYLPTAGTLDDVFAGESAARAGTLDARPCAPAAVCLGRPARLWVGCWKRCADPLGALLPDQAAAVRAAGYRPVATWPVRWGSVSLYEPAPPGTGAGP